MKNPSDDFNSLLNINKNHFYNGYALKKFQMLPIASMIAVNSSIILI